LRCDADLHSLHQVSSGVLVGDGCRGRIIHLKRVTA
jgi:hypothetical protein